MATLYCTDCVYSFVPMEQKLVHYMTSPFSKIPGYAYKCKYTSAEAKEIKISPVTGPEKVKFEYPSCFENRRFDSECGHAATHWAPKHKKDLFKMLTKDY